MREKVYVLLSGGVDSTTTLAIARMEFPAADFEAVSIDYGQRHVRELQAARKVCEHFNISHHILEVPNFMEGMLVDKGEANEAVPDVDYADLPKGISPTYVTFRNGLFLSLLAARAQAWVMQMQKEDEAYRNALAEDGHPEEVEEPEEFNAYIYMGIHADDGVNWAYPDCTPEFAGPMSAAIYIGTYNRVRVRVPLLYMTKPQVVAAGVQSGAPLEHTWSCYKGGELHCGVCPTCRSRKEAFKIGVKAGLLQRDPTQYAE